MKRVIDGKTYNTETATEIGSASSGGSRSDFGYWTETLYRSPKGQFFIAGEGGPMTQYARSIDQNTRTGGEDMRLMSDAVALEWCEEYAIDADVIAEYFAIEEG